MADKILVRSTPTIRPSLIQYSDIESTKATHKIGNTAQGFNQRIGLLYPIVKVGNLKLTSESIKSLIIRQDSFLPTITLTFVDIDFQFTSRGFPLSNIIVSTFIQSSVKKLKSMAADFLITTVTHMAIPNTSAIVYTLSGELHVPKLHGEYSKAYRNMSSLEALQYVAKDLNLGFADNQPEGTNDTMTWIIPNDSYTNFIHDVIELAYINDNNFFDCFIDRYYVLNFINIEKQFSREGEPDTGFLALNQSILDKRRENPEKDIDTEIEVPIILTNHNSARDSEFFIIDYGIDSNHGEILKNHAIRKYLRWYEHGANNSNSTNDINYRSHYVEPLVSTITNDGALPHTVNIPEFIDQTNNAIDPIVTKGEWLGIDYGNAHASYKFAKYLNKHNKLETEKNMLNITLSGFSVNILRGSRVQVEIFIDKISAMLGNSLVNYDENSKLNQTTSNINVFDDRVATPILDVALSDFYYVNSITYTFRDGEFLTNLSLSRRHWVLPPTENRPII